MDGRCVLLVFSNWVCIYIFFYFLLSQAALETATRLSVDASCKEKFNRFFRVMYDDCTPPQHIQASFALCSSMYRMTGVGTMGTGTGTGYIPTYMTSSPTELSSPQLWNNQGAYHRRGEIIDPITPYVGSLRVCVSDVSERWAVWADVRSILDDNRLARVIENLEVLSAKM